MPTYATITLDDRSGYARSNEPVVVSIPLAEADNLTSFSNLAIRQSGTIIPAQFQVLSRWGAVGDTAAPIRVLQAIFRVASLSANSRDSSTYTLTDGGSGTATGGITVNTAPTDYIEITTGSTAGAGRFRIRKVGAAGGGHNVLESAEVHTGSGFKEVIAAGNSSALYLVGVAVAEDPSPGPHTNSQNAFYRSSSYTTAGTNPLYSVAVETPGTDYPERVVILVTGKFGSTPFQGKNSEMARGASTGSLDVSYEMRYSFYRDSAYVGMDWLIKAPVSAEIISDAAIKHGGLLVEPNFSGPNVDLFVSAHNDSGTQQGEVLPYSTGTPRLFQVVAPNGAGYTFSLNKSGFTPNGSTQLREAFMVLQKNAVGSPTNDRYLVLMHRYGKEQSPHGFWYDSSVACLSLWPTEIGEVATSFTRTYHIFPSQMFYNWQGGILVGDGLYTSSAVRSAWSRMCRSPIIAYCGQKYRTSQAFGYLPNPAFTRGVTDWDEAQTRRFKWSKALIDASASLDGRTIQSSYDDRNNGAYTYYWWHTHGAWAQGNVCESNRYDMVLRCIHAWMMFGDPEYWEWADRIAQHMCFVCTYHAPDAWFSGVHWSWLQYSEGSLIEGGLHAVTPSIGVQAQINHNMYKPMMYMLTGYQPYKDAAQKLVSLKGGLRYITDGYEIGDNGDTLLAKWSRYFTFGIEEFLSIFLMQGDTTSLQYARNLAINVVCFTDDVRTLDGSTVATEGGLGMMPVLEHGGSNDAPLWTTYTFIAYAAEAMVQMHQVGTWARAHGYTAQISQAELDRIRTFIWQNAKYCFTGPDALSRNFGETAAQRGTIVRPIVRGHHKTGGNNTLFASAFQWRWATTDLGQVDTRSTDTGVDATHTTTASVTNNSTSVTLAAAGAFDFSTYFFYVDADGVSTAIPIATMSGTSVTLASPYQGSTGSGKPCTIALGGVNTLEGWAQSINLLAYASQLYRAAGDTARANYALTVCRDLFENIYLYAEVIGTFTNWDQSFTATQRGKIYLGNATSYAERQHGWHTRKSSLTYLALEQALMDETAVHIFVRN